MSTSSAFLPVDDPRRPRVRLAVFLTVLAAAIFSLFSATKFIPQIYAHSPWLNDPFDTVISFTMFFVPLVTAFLLVQVSLCRRSEALSVRRVAAILRECRVALGAMVIDYGSASIAVAVRANDSAWNGAATGLEIGLLATGTVAAAAAIFSLTRTPALPTFRTAGGEEPPDWIGDALAAVTQFSRRLGFVRPSLSWMASWCDEALMGKVRRHPVISAALVSACFSATVFGWQAFRESYTVSVTLIAMGLGFCGMFAFLVPAGSYLGIVRSTNPAMGMRRRALDGSVAACAAAVMTLAFRQSLWWLVGTSPKAARSWQFALLLGMGMVAAFALVALAETAFRSHAEGPARSYPSGDR